MKRLDRSLLSNKLDNVQFPDYELDSVKTNIVHFGVGNFHRAHQAVYCHKLLNQGELDWGITGVSLRATPMFDALAPQDFLYTEMTLGDTSQINIIGSIRDILIAPDDPQKVLALLTSNNTKVVTTTITEKGYYLASNAIDIAHEEVANDLADAQNPKTIYGYLAAAIELRMKAKADPLTIVCCDNLQGGGEHLEKGTYMVLEKHYPEAALWAKTNIAFVSSMVDRVTPATSEKTKCKVADELGVYDEWPVAAEPFTQWVIEDKFIGERPPFDKVGAEFVDSIHLFEQMKLRLLNASHSIISAMGYLVGDNFVHQALARPAIFNFVEQMVTQQVIPVISIPADADGNQYFADVIKRFENSHLPYRVLQVGTDSSQKVAQRWYPSIDDGLANQLIPNGFAFALAAWACYIKQALEKGDLNDPLKAVFSELLEEQPKDFINSLLVLTGAEKFNFYQNSVFINYVNDYYQHITEHGLLQALASFTIK